MPKIAIDHPRGCGEKQAAQHYKELGLGSPPRVRGKVQPCRGWIYDSGITPAGAGKSVSFILYGSFM